MTAESTPTPQEIALAAVREVRPGRFGVCLYVCDRGDYVIWTRGNGWGGTISDERLSVANTPPERLIAHLKGFCQNVTGNNAIVFD